MGSLADRIGTSQTCERFIFTEAVPADYRHEYVGVWDRERQRVVHSYKGKTQRSRLLARLMADKLNRSLT